MAKILIIEDEVETAKLLVSGLSRHGFETVVANDAYQGTEFAHKEKPDLIILDLMLPAGGGIFVLRNLRLSLTIAHIPIIVVTGNQDAQYKQKVLDEGVEAYLGKPFVLEELIDAIQNILKE